MLVFIADHSKIIFEVQAFTLSNNVDFVDENNKDNQDAFWHDMFSAHLELINARSKASCTEDLNDIFKYKINQRIALSNHVNTNRYNPDFLIIHRKEKITPNSAEEQKIRFFFEKYEKNIVIKTDGFLGAGNIFCKELSLSFNELIKKINTFITLNKPILIEEVKIFQHSKSYRAINTTLYKRSVVLYEKETDFLLALPVYKHIMDIESPDSHKNEFEQLKVKGFFHHSFFTSMKKLNAKNDIKLAEENIFFKNVARSLDDFIENINNKVEIKDHEIFLSLEDEENWQKSLNIKSPTFLPRFLEIKDKNSKDGNYFASKKELTLLSVHYNEIKFLFQAIINKFPYNYLQFRDSLAFLYSFLESNISEKHHSEIIKHASHLYMESTLDLEDYEGFLKIILKNNLIDDHQYNLLFKEKEIFIKKNIVSVSDKDGLNRLRKEIANISARIDELDGLKNKNLVKLERLRIRIVNEINESEKNNFFKLKYKLLELIVSYQETLDFFVIKAFFSHFILILLSTNKEEQLKLADTNEIIFIMNIFDTSECKAVLESISNIDEFVSNPAQLELILRSIQEDKKYFLVEMLGEKFSSENKFFHKIW